MIVRRPQPTEADLRAWRGLVAAMRRAVEHAPSSPCGELRVAAKHARLAVMVGPEIRENPCYLAVRAAQRWCAGPTGQRRELADTVRRLAGDVEALLGGPPPATDDAPPPRRFRADLDG